MALSVSGFDNALDYKIVYESAGGTTANKNVALSSGTLLSAYIDNSTGSNPCYLKIFDGPNAVSGTSRPDMILKCKNGERQRYEIQSGFPFSELNFWVTKFASPTDTTAPVMASGSVSVTLICTAG